MALHCLGTCSSIWAWHTRLSVIYGPTHVISLPSSPPTICHHRHQTAGSSLHPTTTTLFFFSFRYLSPQLLPPFLSKPLLNFYSSGWPPLLRLNPLPGQALLPLLSVPTMGMFNSFSTLPLHCYKILSEWITLCTELQALLGQRTCSICLCISSKEQKVWHMAGTQQMFAE